MPNKTGTERRPFLLFSCSHLPIPPPPPPEFVAFKKNKDQPTPPKFITTQLQTMKGLFKPKTRSPVELVRYANELLLFIDRNEEVREQKRADKVFFMFLSMILLKISSGLLYFHYMVVDFFDFAS